MIVYGSQLVQPTVANYGTFWTVDTVQTWQNGDTAASLTTLPTVSKTSSSEVHVGTYTGGITIAGAVDPDYTITYVAGNLTITPTTAALTITALAQQITYGQALTQPTIADYGTVWTASGFLPGDSIATLTALPTVFTVDKHVQATPYVGGITIAGAIDSDYSNITYVYVDLTIIPANLTIIAMLQQISYGSPLVQPTVANYGTIWTVDTVNTWKNGDTAASLTTLPAVSKTSSSEIQVGTYTGGMTIGGAVDPDYNISYTVGDLTITPANLKIIAKVQSIVYGSQLVQPTVANYGTFWTVDTVQTWQNGDTAASLTTLPTVSKTSSSEVHVGTYTGGITIGGAVDPDYTITYVTGNLTITPAALTITADNKSMLAGGTLPAFTVTYAGFVNGDTAASLTKLPTITTTATSTSPAGTYPITPSGAVDPDYTFTYKAGVLTVEATTNAVYLIPDPLNPTLTALLYLGHDRQRHDYDQPVLPPAA